MKSTVVKKRKRMPAEPTNTRAESADGPRRYAKGVIRRQQILDRTLEVFNDRGFEATSLRAIGEAIGVSHAALTHYFESREQLLLEVLREWDRLAAQYFLDHHQEGVVDFAVSAADYDAQVPGLTALYSIMLASALEAKNKLSRDFFVERFEKSRRLLMQRLEAGQASGQIRKDVSPRLAASLIIAASDGMAIQSLLDPRVDMREGMQVLESLLSPATDPPATSQRRRPQSNGQIRRTSR